jgi:hypothetical protein
MGVTGIDRVGSLYMSASCAIFEITTLIFFQNLITANNADYDLALAA